MADILSKAFQAFMNDKNYKSSIAVLDFNGLTPIIPTATVTQPYTFNESTIIYGMSGIARDAAPLVSNGIYLIDIRFANNKVITSAPVIAASLFGMACEVAPYLFPKPLVFEKAGDSIRVSITNIGANNINFITIAFWGAYDATQGAG